MDSIRDALVSMALLSDAIVSIMFSIDTRNDFGRESKIVVLPVNFKRLVRHRVLRRMEELKSRVLTLFASDGIQQVTLPGVTST